MKLSFLIICLFSCLVSPALSQTSNPQINQLVSSSWIIRQHSMSGAGLHESLPEGTMLNFQADGTWESTQPIFEARSGHWELTGDKFRMRFEGQSKALNGKLLSVTDSELRFRLKRLTAVYTFEWSR